MEELQKQTQNRTGCKSRHYTLSRVTHTNRAKGSFRFSEVTYFSIVSEHGEQMIQYNSWITTILGNNNLEILMSPYLLSHLCHFLKSACSSLTTVCLSKRRPNQYKHHPQGTFFVLSCTWLKDLYRGVDCISKVDDNFKTVFYSRFLHHLSAARIFFVALSE